MTAPPDLLTLVLMAKARELAFRFCDGPPVQIAGAFAVYERDDETLGFVIQTAILKQLTGEEVDMADVTLAAMLEDTAAQLRKRVIQRRGDVANAEG